MNAYANAFAFTNYLNAEGLAIQFVNRDRRDDLDCVRLKGKVGGVAFRVQFDEDGEMSARFQANAPWDGLAQEVMGALFKDIEMTDMTVELDGATVLTFARRFHRLYSLLIALNV